MRGERSIHPLPLPVLPRPLPPLRSSSADLTQVPSQSSSDHMRDLSSSPSLNHFFQLKNRKIEKIEAYSQHVDKPNSFGLK